MARNKGFACIAILALALGIGPNVAIFSIILATFLAPLPYPHADQLVVVWSKVKGERHGSRADDYLQYVAQSRSFQSLGFFQWEAHHLTGADHQQEEITGQSETPGVNTGLFGLHMALGRDLAEKEGTPGNQHVVTLTHRLWQERFGSDPAILGRQVRIDDEPYTVIGVLEAGVADRIPAQFYLPAALVLGDTQRPWGEDWGNVMGRLKDGVTLAQAQAELSVIDRRLAATRGGSIPKAAWTVSVEPLKNDWLDKKLERNLWLLLGAVGFVLLIACTNIANLLLARGAARQGELAVRAALGATRRQIFAQLLTESMALAAAGGATGIALGWGLMRLSMAILPDLARQTSEAIVELNLPVLGFAVAVSMAAGLLAGCAPAWQAARLNLSEMLKQGSRATGGGGRSKIQRYLVIGEFAMALTLLAGAGIALHSFWNLTHLDLGVRTDHILTGSMQVQKTASRDPAKLSADGRQLLAQLAALPDVQDAAFTTTLPLEGYDPIPFSIAGQPVSEADRLQSDFVIVTPSYFSTFGVQLIRGRLLNNSDQAGSVPTVVVNQSFVNRYLQGKNPLEQRLIFDRSSADPRTSQPNERQIVGVFHDVRNGEHLNDETAPEMFVSFWQRPTRSFEVAVRTALDPALVSGSLRATVAQVIPGDSLVQIEPAQQLVDSQLSGDRFGGVLFGGFALLALCLAALGIYGVLAFAVAQRRHEIGLRMALGAQQRDVVLMILGEGVRLAFYGSSVGLIGAFVLGYLMRGTVYGVESVDLGTLACVAFLLMLVAVIASYVPARRCARVNPMIALREP